MATNLIKAGYSLIVHNQVFFGECLAAALAADGRRAAVAGDVPAALDQGALPPESLQSRALAWGQQLVGAGVNLDLAPVLDTVPPGTASSRP